MEANYILVRFGELTTKGKNRKTFIGQLYSNTKASLKQFKTLEYERTFDRLYIHLNDENKDEVVEALKKVFGIYSFSVAYKVNTDLEEIQKAALTILEQANRPLTFKVDTKRSYKDFPMQSQEINRAVATYLFHHATHSIKVDVHEPELRIKIEIRKDNSYIFDEVIKGAGGYPVGIGGKALLMLSGGIDSPVAGYMTLKRGVAIECIHYASPPYTSDRAKEKVVELVRALCPFSQGSIVLHTIPFTDLQLAIYEHAEESYAITIMRRMMYRIATEVANRRNCLAITNGESIGQVASQTLNSMQVINEVTNIPVIRPVACLDKLEIIDIAQRINTYDISIQPFEDCCTIFTPKQPATKPKSYKAEAYEAKFDYQSLINECIEQMETITIHLEEKNDEDIF